MLHVAFLCANVRRHVRYVSRNNIITKYQPHSTTIPIGSLDVASFADRLWGDIYFNTDTRKFTRKQADPESDRTFVHFIMEPLYKLYSHVLSEETDTLKETLVSLGIKLKPVMFKMDVRPLLRAVLDQFFGSATGLVDVIVDHVPSPVEGAAFKVIIFRPCENTFSSTAYRLKERIRVPRHLIWLGR